MLARIFKYSVFATWHDYGVYVDSPLCFCIFFDARASALTRLLHTLLDEDHAIFDYYWLGR